MFPPQNTTLYPLQLIWFVGNVNSNIWKWVWGSHGLCCLGAVIYSIGLRLTCFRRIWEPNAEMLLTSCDQQWNKWLWFICFCLQRLFSRLFSHKDVTQRSWWQSESQCWCSSGKNKAASRKGKQSAGRHSKRWELDNAPPVWGQISSGKIAKLFSNERLFFWFLSSCSWNLVEVLTVVTRGNVSEAKRNRGFLSLL